MRLTRDESLRRLASAERGVLSTLHPDRGIDAVPVVFAVSGDRLAVPVDRVKAKSATRLQRERNLRGDPRATLLVDHWDGADWSRLWWVRVNLVWRPEDEGDPALRALLIEKYRQYDTDSFVRVIGFRVGQVSGWAASDGEASE